MKTRRASIMNVLIINIETKNYVCFQTDRFSTLRVLDENYVHLPIKKYNEKISMKLASHEYFSVLDILTV